MKMDELKNQGGDILNFVLPKNQSSYIKVIGVGGGGSNAVNHMFRAGITGVDFVVCNTDAQALESSPVPVKIQLGKGLGAGNVPQVAREAAIEKHDEIKDAIKDAKMLFVTAGMGGGTGTGAAPVVASIAKEIELVGDEVTKILTVAIVTTPFSFEGRKRQEQAKAGIAELRKTVDAILVINNDKLKEFGKMTLMEAFAMADDVLTTAAKGISEIITVRSYVQIDFKDVNTVMHDSGVALMGFGSAEGEDRAEKAALQAMESPLLNDNSIEGAKNMLLYFGYGAECPLIMDEIEIITSAILNRAGEGVDLIWGAGEDDTLGKKLNITLIATGFNEKKALGQREVEVMVLDNDEKKASMETRETRPETERVESASVEKTDSAVSRPRIIGVLDENGDVQLQSELTVSDCMEEKNPQETGIRSEQQDGVRPMASEPAPMAGLEAQVDSWYSEFSEAFMAAAPAEGMAKGDEGSSGNFGDPVVLSKEESRPAMPFSNPRAPIAATQGMVQAQVSETLTEVAESQKEEKPAFGQMLKQRLALNHERLARMKEISSRIKTPEELNQIEREPAFKRQGIRVEFTNTASVSEASRHVIGKDGQVVVNDPPFLADKAD